MSIATSDLYLSCLSEDLRAGFQAILHITSLDGEIALLRTQIQKLIKSDPDNLKMILRIVHLIERLVKCNLQVRKETTPPGKPLQSFNLEDIFNQFSAAAAPDPASPEIADPLVQETPRPASEASDVAAASEEAPAPDSPPSSTPPPAPAVPVHHTWPTSSVAKKAPAARLPASARSLFHRKKHKKH
jgi:hypothetical protein